MAALVGKLQGIKSQFSFTPPGGSAPVTLKSVSSWDIKVTADTVDASDHDTAGWGDFLPGLATWTATVKVVRYEGDTGATQNALEDALATALTGDGDVACSFFPYKNAGNAVYTGTAVVTDYSPSDGGTKGIQGIDFTLKGRGPLVRTVQAS